MTQTTFIGADFCKTAPRWRIFLAKLFGKKIDSFDGTTVVVARQYRGVIYIIDVHKLQAATGCMTSGVIDMRRSLMTEKTETTNLPNPGNPKQRRTQKKRESINKKNRRHRLRKKIKYASCKINELIDFVAAHDCSDCIVFI